MASLEASSRGGRYRDRYVAVFMDDHRAEEHLIADARERARLAGRYDGETVVVEHDPLVVKSNDIGRLIVVHVYASPGVQCESEV